MTRQAQVLRQLVQDGQYDVNPVAVANAIVLRATARDVVPTISFQGAERPAPRVRSFRRHSGASFRLCRDELLVGR
jgi:hypothetical protein